jgi:hypothetical protein
MKKHIVQILILVCITCVCGCSRTAEPDESQIIANLTNLIEENQNAMHAENIDALLSTIHPESEMYEEAEEMLPQMWKMMDISSKLLSIRIIGVERDFVFVNVIQSVSTKFGDKEESFTNDAIAVYREQGGALLLWDAVETKKTGPNQPSEVVRQPIN